MVNSPTGSNGHDECTVLPYFAEFPDDEKQLFHRACVGSSSYKSADGRPYCVMHFPDNDKVDDFEKAIAKKRFNFRGVWFPAYWVRFRSRTFSETANFKHATFGGDASFVGAEFREEADFTEAKFEGEPVFTHATFCGEASFEGAEFKKDAYFNNARFNNGAIFDLATFHGEAPFNNVCFKKFALFVRATFNGLVSFNGNKAFASEPYLSLQYAQFSELANLSVHEGKLHPSWFIKVDGLKTFRFNRVSWYGVLDGPQGSIDKEVQILTGALSKAEHERTQKSLKRIEPIIEGTPTDERLVRQKELHARRALAVAYRQLALNAEENHYYEEAAEFRYSSAEAQRKQALRGFVPWKPLWWHWLLSGHSERPAKALLWLLGIWLVFAMLYAQSSFLGMQFGFEQTQQGVVLSTVAKEHAPLTFSNALIWSFGAMGRLIGGPSTPMEGATGATQTLIFLEGVLGPLLIALLALAIRRKVMR